MTTNDYSGLIRASIDESGTITEVYRKEDGGEFIMHSPNGFDMGYDALERIADALNPSDSLTLDDVELMPYLSYVPEESDTGRTSESRLKTSLRGGVLQ